MPCDNLYLLEEGADPFWFCMQKRSVLIQGVRAELVYLRNMSPLV